MCEPVSITMGALAVAGGAAKAVGDHQAGAAKAAAMRRNAEVADMAASDALQRGDQAAGKVQMQGEAASGQQRAGFAGQGVVVGDGSSGRTAADTAAFTDIDIEQTRNNAQREAWGLKTQATNMRDDAKAAISAAKYAVVGDLIGGASGAAGATMTGLQSTGYFKPSPVAPGKKD